MKNLFGYDFIIKQFLEKIFSAEEFEVAYQEKFLSNSNTLDDDIFLILDWLFAEIEAFTNDRTVFPDDSIDENQLRKSASDALGQLFDLK